MDSSIGSTARERSHDPVRLSRALHSELRRGRSIGAALLKHSYIFSQPLLTAPAGKMQAELERRIMRLPLLCVFLACAIGIANDAKQARPAPDPRSLILVGDRFKPLKYDDMTPEQKTMIDHLLAGERRGANGPFNVLLRSPEVGDLAQQFGGAMRFRTGLPRDVSEVIIIMTGCFWTAQYEWNSHKN